MINTEIRKTVIEDLPFLLEIYSRARRFMAEHGNPNQWSGGRPKEERIIKDIESGRSFVCEESGKIIGTFFFDRGFDIDPTYRVIYDGKWGKDGEYGVIHRLASDGTKGVGTFCINYALSGCDNLRIDTHPDNIVMRNLLKKLGFAERGLIRIVEDTTPRIAFDKIK